MVCCAGYSVIQTLGILLDIRKAKNTRLARLMRVFHSSRKSCNHMQYPVQKTIWYRSFSRYIVDFGKYRAKVACLYLGTAH